MVTSRVVLLSRSINQITKLKPFNVQNNGAINRLSHSFNYRVPPPPAPLYVRVGAHVLGGFMWWWILWHLWHEPEHIMGEFPYHNPSDWTDAELGIPPDE